ncbi:MAG: hypothetical protein NZ480_07650 [Bdellovibrionaceae bacterium]|nr:hypothetical protein [Pseudobdellovibrionaceae bacterium]
MLRGVWCCSSFEGWRIHNMVSSLRYYCFLFFVYLWTLGCSFPDQQPLGDLQRDLRDRDKINDIFRSIQGTYEGSLEFPQYQRSTEALLILSFRETPVGTDNDGQNKFRPRLTGRLIQKELIFPDIRFEGVYEPVTGDITLSTAPDAKDKYFFRTRLIGGVLQGELRSQDAIYGYLKVKQTSQDVPQIFNERKQEINRVKSILAPYVGQYEALVDEIEPFFSNISITPFAPGFYIRLIEHMHELPTLELTFSMDHLPVATGVVHLETRANPIEISVSIPRGPGVSLSFNLVGHVIKDSTQIEIKGRITFPTFKGRIRAIRKIQSVQ